MLLLAVTGQGSQSAAGVDGCSTKKKRGASLFRLTKYEVTYQVDQDFGLAGQARKREFRVDFLGG